MKTARYERATVATSDVSPATTTSQAAVPGKLYLFQYKAAASSRIHRQRWDHAEHIEDFQMLARLKALSAESKSQVVRLVDDLYASEVEERKLCEIGKSRKLLAQIWDNSTDAEYNNL